jgi:hypothetical protein
MNFDISDRPIKLSLSGFDQLLIFQKDGSSFYPAFGINRSGSFMNLLMVDPNEAGKYRRGKGCVHIIRIFDDILGGRVSPDGLDSYLMDKTVVNVPEISVHSMIAGRDRRAYVVEPGRANIPFTSESSDFLILTNFPLSDFIDRDYRDVTGNGAERYKTCFEMLSERKHAFNVNHGFVILEATSQSAGDYPTQLSMLAVPEDETVFFATKRDFGKRFVFSFEDNTLRLQSSSTQQEGFILERKGILLSELEQW